MVELTGEEVFRLGVLAGPKHTTYVHPGGVRKKVCPGLMFLNGMCPEI